MSELLIFLLMIVIFAGSCFFLKLPVGIALLLSSVGGALAGGFGVPVKFMVEGTMSFLDTILGHCLCNDFYEMHSVFWCP